MDIEGYNKKPEKISFYKGLWRLFIAQDKFTKMSLITMFIIIIVTPVIVTTRLIYFQHAADSTTFIASEGAKPIFSLTNFTNDTQPVSGATFSWTTSAPAKCKLFLWEDNTLQNFFAFLTLGRLTFTETDYTVPHSFMIPGEGLKPNTKYNYQIVATDQSNEEFDSKVYSFTTVYQK